MGNLELRLALVAFATVTNRATTDDTAAIASMMAQVPKPSSSALSNAAAYVKPSGVLSTLPNSITAAPTPIHHGKKIACSGFEEEWAVCESKSCDGGCKPVHCEFSDWQQWFDAGGCSQVAFRERQIAVPNNECGEPCNGAKIESQRINKSECVVPMQDCELGDWDDWSDCAKKAPQKIRARKIVKMPFNGGKPCDLAVTQETVECEDTHHPISCAVSPWHEWTTCSATCGIGQYTRMRRISAHAVYPGTVCKESLQEVSDCQVKACASKDCLLGPWMAWSQCLDGHSQSYRSRYVTVQVVGIGVPCEGKMKETRACPRPPVINCSFSQWSMWGSCDKECDGGQTTRSRHLTVKPQNGGTCDASVSLLLTKPCNTMPCKTPYLTADCILSSWTTWSKCSAACGEGSTFRSRGIAALAKGDGLGCIGDLKEVSGCKGPANCSVDCKWSEWYDWSACTCTCGGGTKVRSRVVAQAPRLDGKLCDDSVKSEVDKCNMQACEKGCIDATWGAWSQWSECSTTCDDGFVARQRSIDRQANACGKALEGTREEYKACSGGVACIPDADCLLSEWNDWSYCSCSCFGNRERNRVIKQFARGRGRSCVDEALKESEPCNPGLTEVSPLGCGVPIEQDCILGVWSSWSACSRTCGSGQKEMTRNITQYPSHGGKLCVGALRKVAGCAEVPCTPETCTDCKWGDWQNWGDCSHCGGQRYRFRHIVTYPNHCGQPCDERSAKEVGNCTSKCGKEILTCAWTSWSTSAGCQANSCGGSSMRTRNLGLLPDSAGWKSSADGLFEAREDALCTGTQLFTETCDRSACRPECIPQNCIFGSWTEWTQQTCLGLCIRSRVVAKHNNHCGTPCDGDLEESKRCEGTCDKKVDCVIGEWTTWSICKVGVNQQSRSRVIKTYPMNGGKPCDGVLAETKACGGPVVMDCELSPWSGWTPCSKTCNSGTQTRERSIAQQAANGGELCIGSLKELSPCNTNTCGTRVDCDVSDWSHWSECDINRMKTRERIISTLSVGGGVACSDAAGNGDLKETMTCNFASVDCKLSEWTKWDNCDRPCGMGQTQRHRQVHIFPSYGGKACPEVLTMQQGCNTQKCHHSDCVYSLWSQWSQCSSNCGTGQTMRYREISREATENGMGCTGIMKETQACPTNLDCPTQDCIWGEWTEWSSCTCTCGGGQTNRIRHIQQMPSPGGSPCLSKDREVVMPCNTQPCGGAKVDGEWGDWSSWSACSATCQTGFTWRLRKVAKMASESGQPPYGKDRESEFCNANITCEEDEDCIFTDWDAWSDCSASCSGVKRRQRRIGQYGKGKGDYCIGALKETYPCNIHLPVCEEPKVDCVLSDWQAWSACSATCGTGQHYRSRGVVTPPSRGGKGCGDGDTEDPVALRQVSDCLLQTCNGTSPINCEYGEWEDWNACGKCGGQRKRFRHITRMPRFGGKNCEQFASEETGACPFFCEQHGYCVWDGWSQYGPCSALCGKGKKMRTRKLVFTWAKPNTSIPDTHDLLQKYAELSAHAEALESRDGLHEMFASFGLGFITLGVSVIGFRLVTSSRRPPHASEAHRQMVRIAETEPDDELPLTQERADSRGRRVLGI